MAGRPRPPSAARVRRFAAYLQRALTAAAPQTDREWIDLGEQVLRVVDDERRRRWRKRKTRARMSRDMVTDVPGHGAQQGASTTDSEPGIAGRRDPYVPGHGNGCPGTPPHTPPVTLMDDHRGSGEGIGDPEGLPDGGNAPGRASMDETFPDLASDTRAVLGAVRDRWPAWPLDQAAQAVVALMRRYRGQISDPVDVVDRVATARAGNPDGVFGLQAHLTREFEYEARRGGSLTGGGDPPVRIIPMKYDLDGGDE